MLVVVFTAIVIPNDLIGDLILHGILRCTPHIVVCTTSSTSTLHTLVPLIGMYSSMWNVVEPLCSPHRVCI